MQEKGKLFENLLPSSNMQRAPQPSCFDRVKVGFGIGFAVGMSSAALFGTYSALRFVVFKMLYSILPCLQRSLISI